VLLRQANLYLHSESVLPCSGDSSGGQVHFRNRYVVARLHFSRALYRGSYFSRGKLKLADVYVYVASRNASSSSALEGRTQKEVFY
jgi:hypothetical protein